ncbi:MAG: YdcF family protein [Alphaproteobacteria bacterium]|nr:YdcF family protein [Alphaproteobacteria bacterium]
MGLTAAVLTAGLLPASGFLALAAWLDRQGRDEPPDRSWDVAVVAGCRVMPDGTPSLALARRVGLAVHLFHTRRARLIVLTGGQGADAPITEAHCAAELCRHQGVPDAALILEDRSTTTLENAAFTHRVLGSGSTDLHVIVVTDAAHTFRCRRMFGRHFRVVHSAGAAVEGWPRVRAALREAAAVLRHGLSGRL